MITCERCQTENIDGAQYCDECGSPLAGRASADARTPILQMLSKPLTHADDAEPAVVSPDAPTKHDGRNNNDGDAAASVALSEAASAVRTSMAARATPAAATASAARAAGGAHSAHAALVINRGRSAGKEFPVHEDEAYIGRWDADSGIFPDVDLDSDDPEAKVSRRHARITRRGEQYYIEDLGSTNGTFINRGRRLLPGDRQPLNDGDEIIIGKTFLRFHVTK
ncbi:MAG TPA: FHA domain-containing protein [Pyrinomonadaceae bacterium]|jgi:hypothetical protein|nr:FHA domain-containing protein [Pyrinomonadaceae bacterium]